MDDQQWFAEHFPGNGPGCGRSRTGMLGSMTEAEDAPQEAWIRSIRSDSSAIDNINGRLCIDVLRARRTRRGDADRYDVARAVACG